MFADVFSGNQQISTSVEQGAIKVEAASIVPCHQLNQVTDPSVACTWKTGERHQGGGSVRQKHPLFAPGV